MFVRLIREIVEGLGPEVMTAFRIQHGRIFNSCLLIVDTFRFRHPAPTHEGLATSRPFGLCSCRLGAALGSQKDSFRDHIRHLFGNAVEK